MKREVIQFNPMGWIFLLIIGFYSGFSQGSPCEDSFLDNPEPTNDRANKPANEAIVLSPHMTSKVFKIEEVIEAGDNANLASMAIHYQSEALNQTKTYVANMRNQKGESLLIMASRNGRTEIAKYLLSLGADPQAETQVSPFSAHIDQLNGRPMTALKWAVKEGHLELVQLLLKKGASLTQQVETDFNFDLWDSLTLATQNGHKEIIEFLFSKKYSLIVEKDYAYLLLASAVTHGKKEIVDYIIDFLQKEREKGIAIKAEKLKSLAIERQLETHISKEIVANYYRFSMWQIIYQGNTEIALYFFSILFKNGHSIDSNKVIDLIRSTTNTDIIKFFSERIIVGVVFNMDFIMKLIEQQKGSMEIIDDILKKDLDSIRDFVLNYPEVIKKIFHPKNMSRL